MLPTVGSTGCGAGATDGATTAPLRRNPQDPQKRLDVAFMWAHCGQAMVAAPGAGAGAATVAAAAEGAGIAAATAGAGPGARCWTAGEIATVPPSADTA